MVENYQSFLNTFWEYLSKGIVPVASLLIGVAIGMYRDNRKMIFDKKLIIYSDIISETSQHLYMDGKVNFRELAKLLAPARLISGGELQNCIREYYSLVTEYWNLSDSEEKDNKSAQITMVGMEIEQLMRKELGVKRFLSKSKTGIKLLK
ncbi:MAG: hypothetical protein RLY57_11 [Candidatus Parcubacteria bacterium]|jgi:hypothetical protein